MPELLTPSATSSSAHEVIGAYLTSLAAMLDRTSPATERALDEIRDHLVAALETHRDPTAEDAIAEVLAFGEPRAVASAFSAESRAMRVARSATYTARWSVVLLIGVAVVARMTFALDGPGHLERTDAVVLGISALATAVAVALGSWSYRSARRSDPTTATGDRVIAALVASVGATCVGFAAIVALGGDLLADSIRHTSRVFQLGASAVGIVLAAVVSAELLPLIRVRFARDAALTPPTQ